MAAFARVAVLAPLGRGLTYAVPEALAAKAVPGARVIVPLGPRKVLGVVLADESEMPPGIRAKAIVSVVDDEPAVPIELLKFLQELASYYFAPIGETLRLALPAVSREDAKKLDQRVQTVGGRKVLWATATDAIEEPGSLRGNAGPLLAMLRGHGALPLSNLVERFSTARAIITKLEAAGLVVTDQRETAKDAYFATGVPRDVPKEATEAQIKAIAAITTAITERKPGAFLLYGVTGSGKTEVYLRAIAACVEQGRGALVLVPEIALTPQLVGRFRARFGDVLSVHHSGLSPRDRQEMWLALRQGKVKVAIGARSALFAPVPDLGLVIVDEEHDGSFKQEEGIRYHARDMALLRAHRAGAACVLGSATPSLESIYLTRTDRAKLLRLPARAHATSRLPETRIVDLRRTGPGPTGDKRLSLPLHRAMREALDRKEQIILFLNRRGFAPSVVCDSCGQIAQCPSCSVALTLHRRGDLRCHYCDYFVRFDDRCPTCKADTVSLEGVGTERLEDSVTRGFPEAKVDRLDRDVASGAKAEAIVERLRAKETDILVGTQMVAKGHDVPNVTLVGVVNADAALSMPDFRASERAFQLLVQVAGRAGRGDLPGKVIFQTRDPKHPALVMAAKQDVDAFLESELGAREELNYPPFSRLALIRVDAENEDVARKVAAALAEIARKTATESVDVLGPTAAPIARLRGRFRFRVMLRAKERRALRRVLAALDEALAKVPRGARAVLDVDPVSMLLPDRCHPTATIRTKSPAPCASARPLRSRACGCVRGWQNCSASTPTYR